MSEFVLNSGLILTLVAALLLWLGVVVADHVDRRVWPTRLYVLGVSIYLLSAISFLVAVHLFASAQSGYALAAFLLAGALAYLSQNYTRSGKILGT